MTNRHCTAMNLPSPSNNSSSSRTTSSAPNNAVVLTDTTNQPMQNYDGTELRDAKGKIVYRSQFLSTHPLRGDCKEKPGFGGNRFTYVTGDGVIRTMNAIFGHGGWSSQIVSEKCIQAEKDDRGRWWIGYLVTLRISLLNGSSHEDCGSGEGINPSKIQAHDKAMKSAVTDAMKRAARHFGERLGNALYVKGNGIRVAPKTNREALEVLERNDEMNLFGDQVKLRDKYKMEELQQNRLLLGGDTLAANGGMGNSHEQVKLPPTPVMSTAPSRQTAAINHVAIKPTNQYHNPVDSTVALRQQTATDSSVAAVPINQYTSNSNAAARMPQNQYISNKPQPATALPAAPVVPKSHVQVSHSTNPNAAVWNNVHQQTLGKMPPPDTRGVSPETTLMPASDPSKKMLSCVDPPVMNNVGKNSAVEDSNKRQKRNPYSNNRLSC